MVSQILVCLMTGMLLVAAPLIHAQQKPPEPDPPKTETLQILKQKPPELDTPLLDQIHKLKRFDPKTKKPEEDDTQPTISSPPPLKPRTRTE